jgi:hypothetical protein
MGVSNRFPTCNNLLSEDMTRSERERRTSAVLDGDGDIPRSGSLELELLDGEIGILAGIRDTVSSVASGFESVIERRE